MIYLDKDNGLSSRVVLYAFTLDSIMTGSTLPPMFSLPDCALSRALRHLSISRSFLSIHPRQVPPTFASSLLFSFQVISSFYCSVLVLLFCWIWDIQFSLGWNITVFYTFFSFFVWLLLAISFAGFNCVAITQIMGAWEYLFGTGVFSDSPGVLIFVVYALAWLCSSLLILGNYSYWDFFASL
jgi:hypothetical protein